MRALTVFLDDALDAHLTRLAEQRRCFKNDLVREMLSRAAALAELRRTRAELRPYAERAGYKVDEDFFRGFS